MSVAGDHEAIVKANREIGRLLKENNKYKEALVMIVAQDSGVIGSTKKSDCMAAIAELALRDR